MPPFAIATNRSPLTISFKPALPGLAVRVTGLGARMAFGPRSRLYDRSVGQDGSVCDDGAGIDVYAVADPAPVTDLRSSTDS